MCSCPATSSTISNPPRSRPGCAGTTWPVSLSGVALVPTTSGGPCSSTTAKASPSSSSLSTPVRSSCIFLALGEDLQLGQWYYLVAMSVPGGMRMYLNGVEVDHNSYEGSFAAIGPGENSYLGRSNCRENASFRGALDEVRLWGWPGAGRRTKPAWGKSCAGTRWGWWGCGTSTVRMRGTVPPSGTTGSCGAGRAAWRPLSPARSRCGGRRWWRGTRPGCP